MAFLTVEDLTGSVEIIVFPKDYERYNRFLNDEEKIFVVGHATVEEEQDGKVICERIVPFDDTRKELWLQFPTKSDFSEKEQQVYDILRDSDGNDEVVIYISDVKAFKRLPRNRAVGTNSVLLARLTEFLGEKKALKIAHNKYRIKQIKEFHFNFNKWRISQWRKRLTQLVY